MFACNFYIPYQRRKLCSLQRKLEIGHNLFESNDKLLKQKSMKSSTLHIEHTFPKLMTKQAFIQYIA